MSFNADESGVSKPRRVVSDEARPGKGKCRGCGSRLTWAAQMQQFWRAVNRGASEDVAKAISPRCQKCMTIYLRQEKR